MGVVKGNTADDLRRNKEKARKTKVKTKKANLAQGELIRVVAQKNHSFTRLHRLLTHPDKAVRMATERGVRAILVAFCNWA